MALSFDYSNDPAFDLFPEPVRASVPALYATEREKDPLVHVKLFFPLGSWTWYIIEAEYDAAEDDWLFFGWVEGLDAELGYFSLGELEGVRLHGLRVERDLWFTPCRLSELRARRAA